ncbi:MAG: hypothetical protein ACKO38_16980 [Planctomycetota bacterium]
MPIEFRCSGCGKLLRTPDESGGQKARCPGCGTIVSIPTASTVVADSPANAAGAPPTLGEFRGNPNPFQDSSPNAAGTSGGYGGGAYGGASQSSGGGYGPPGAGVGEMMGPNPYAAPTLARPPQALPTGGPLQHNTLSIDQLLKTTWEILADQFWMAVLLGLIMLALGFVTAFITTPINMAAQATQDIGFVIGGQVVGQLLSVFVQVFIQLGATFTVLNWARTGSIDISNMFKVGPYYLRGLGITLLIQLITFGVILVCAIPLIAFIPSRNEEAMIISGIGGAIVAMPIVVWLALSFYIAIPIMIDRSMSVRESLALSRVFMAGNKLTVFVASLVGSLIVIPVVLCTCGLGAVPFGPAATLFVVLIYLLSTGQAIQRPGVRATQPYPPAGYPPPQYASQPTTQSPFPPPNSPPPPVDPNNTDNRNPPPSLS